MRRKRIDRSNGGTEIGWRHNHKCLRRQDGAECEDHMTSFRPASVSPFLLLIRSLRTLRILFSTLPS